MNVPQMNYRMRSRTLPNMNRLAVKTVNRRNGEQNPEFKRVTLREMLE
jgi:hypothetical protein